VPFRGCSIDVVYLIYAMPQGDYKVGQRPFLDRIVIGFAALN